MGAHSGSYPGAQIASSGHLCVAQAQLQGYRDQGRRHNAKGISELRFCKYGYALWCATYPDAADPELEFLRLALPFQLARLARLLVCAHRLVVRVVLGYALVRARVIQGADLREYRDVRRPAGKAFHSHEDNHQWAGNRLAEPRPDTL